MRAQLIPVVGGPPIELDRDVTVVGRNPSCDLQLEHKTVSKIHCVLVRTDGLVLLRDLGSTNGTRVNGQRVRRAALMPDDEISVAGFRFRLHLGPSEPKVSPVEATQHLSLAAASNGNGSPDSADESAVHVRVNALPDVYSSDSPPS